MDFLQNSFPFFGATAFCMTTIDDLRKDNLKNQIDSKNEDELKYQDGPKYEDETKIKEEPKKKMASIEKTNKNVKVIHANYEWSPELWDIMEDMIQGLDHE